ncbi:MAG: 3-keto-5-aminohexanoate cleavage protein [Micromonosporaceae bacterium]
MLVKACLNGARLAGAHRRLPLTPEQLARDADACAEFGADAVHLHPRDAEGGESLAVADVAAAVAAVRRQCPELAIGVTTGEWILPDLDARLATVGAWTELDDAARPAFASVNLSESGWERVAAALLDGGIGVEAGISEAEDPAKLAASGLAPRLLRVLVEPQATDSDAAIGTADTLIAALAPLGADLPILVHGVEAAAWPVLEWALDAGYDTRIGLEDTLELPDGNPTPDNAALVAAAYAFLMEPH